ncbi:hypothetical protein H6F88_15025 [Oculatella sp. FACHB-28]|jgi:hypothetical protein|uniref:hypothetical protein n=1 Tax=Cyanophyceae TaxID=3028117 RepID=UPI00168316E0|nr:MULTISPECIES: hypothetical protein [Cyanophyceae]MBD1868700.1 hypothetical protein [Cyanobacteria bacterium FACHB-471]MBD1998112.1 hypothetical protein [Leptolyngbya sp. FACHB-541]MBD2057314.1 hypothetical protein [Oculatella sp. FACHB-28]MBD2067865.1 hypothetical protein [Leptolyngbya sp. FACHB-671]
MGFETSPLGILAVTALGLMVAFTGGIAYLTTIEWRDRRRREREMRENQSVSKKKKKK